MSSADVTDERLLTGYSGRMFVTVALGWLVFRMGRAALPPLLSTIISDLSITPVQAGLGLTVMWSLYAIGQFPSGRLSDRLSRKTLLVTALGLLCVGFVVLAGTLTYPLFLLASVLLGLGGGLFTTPSIALMSDHFVERRGQAFGLYAAVGDLGSAGAAAVAVLALAIATWRAPFLPIALALGILLIALHLWNREAYVIGRVDLSVQETVLRLLKGGQIRWLLLAYMFYSFTWQSVTSFLPTFLEVEKGFPVSFASAGFALLFVVGVVVKPISGRLGDSIGRQPVAIGALLFGIVGLSAIVIAERFPLVIFGIIIFAAGLMAYPPVMQAYLMDLFPSDTMGGDFGAIRTIYIGFASLGPTYVGFVAGLESYTSAFIGIIGCLCVSFVLLTALLVRNAA